MKSSSYFFLKNVTFNFALSFSLIIHLFLFSIFGISSLNNLNYKSEYTKIAFIHDNSVLFREDEIYSLAKELFSDTKDISPGHEKTDDKNKKKFIDTFNFLKNKNILEYKPKDKKEKDSILKPTIEINSHRKVLRIYYPVYPIWAKKMRLESEVKLEIKINKRGFVENIVFDKMSDNPELDAIALRAIKKWVFQSALSEVEDHQWASVVLKFNLD